MVYLGTIFKYRFICLRVLFLKDLICDLCLTKFLQQIQRIFAYSALSLYIPLSLRNVEQHLQYFIPFVNTSALKNGFTLNLSHKFLQVITYHDYIFYAYINDLYKTNSHTHHMLPHHVSHTLDTILPLA